MHSDHTSLLYSLFKILKSSKTPPIIFSRKLLAAKQNETGILVTDACSALPVYLFISLWLSIVPDIGRKCVAGSKIASGQQAAQTYTVHSMACARLLSPINQLLEKFH